MSTIALRGIRKSYAGGTPVLRNLSMQFEAGEFVVIVGPSGCGKSTLLRLIAGINRHGRNRQGGDAGQTFGPIGHRDDWLRHHAGQHADILQGLGRGVSRSCSAMAGRSRPTTGTRR